MIRGTGGMSDPWSNASRMLDRKVREAGDELPSRGHHGRPVALIELRPQVIVLEPIVLRASVRCVRAALLGGSVKNMST